MQASGRVLATSVTGDTDGEYTVMVFASQKTQNVQNPQPSELPTLLKVVVSKTAGAGRSRTMAQLNKTETACSAEGVPMKNTMQDGHL